MFQRKLRLLNLLAVFTLLHSNTQMDRYSQVSAVVQTSATQDATASNIFPTGYDVAPAGRVLESMPSDSNPEPYDATAFASGQSGLYQPIGEVVVPTGDQLTTRGVEEKDGYVYLLTRTEFSALPGYLYTYNVSDLPTQTSFARYNSPISTRQLPNGNGLLRNGNYMYAFGNSGLL